MERSSPSFFPATKSARCSQCQRERKVSAKTDAALYLCGVGDVLPPAREGCSHGQSRSNKYPRPRGSGQGEAGTGGQGQGAGTGFSLARLEMMAGPGAGGKQPQVSGRAVLGAPVLPQGRAPMELSTTRPARGLLAWPGRFLTGS